MLLVLSIRFSSYDYLHTESNRFGLAILNDTLQLFSRAFIDVHGLLAIFKPLYFETHRTAYLHAEVRKSLATDANRFVMNSFTVISLNGMLSFSIDPLLCALSNPISSFKFICIINK